MANVDHSFSVGDLVSRTDIEEDFRKEAGIEQPKTLEGLVKYILEKTNTTDKSRAINFVERTRRMVVDQFLAQDPRLKKVLDNITEEEMIGLVYDSVLASLEPDKMQKIEDEVARRIEDLNASTIMQGLGEELRYFTINEEDPLLDSDELQASKEVNDAIVDEFAWKPHKDKRDEDLPN
jgi:hypothetical protein